MSRPQLLSPAETFEKYERRSPAFHSPIPATSTPNESVIFVGDVDALRPREIPYGWIICIACCVPIFIIFVLAMAVWLQELGWI
ncbi:unnamed protein product [Bursaphelenchus okinawaensis]|uniref:Uncharacterized protein n=1 Tax=Bursaphelenchus okinawaensis TaxID=465554 RepID=A0A811JUA6_9BILA|nr:unnamed protein product [Bursaphelenchus okinawaensis]CAG9083389.1 unnamed protein product [Bursaphelenchus okinawaensis]